jgi:hypothetical protein
MTEFPESESHKYVRMSAEAHGLTYDQMMQAAYEWLEYGEYVCLGTDIYELPREFWYHYGVLTGDKIPLEKQESFFTCSC